jgi:hypothetical protein
MVKIVATQNMPYGNRRYAAGEEFDASDRDAKLLVKIGRAAHVHPASHVHAVFKTENVVPVVEPSPSEAQEAAPGAQPSPRQYTRRDMTAEPAGQTGPAKPPQSSRRGRQPRAST